MACPQLPKRALYALKCLVHLAGKREPARAKEIAHCAGIPPAEASKVLYLLTWGGFVSSRRGSKGGFWLRVAPEKIRIGKVMRFFHPPAKAGRSQFDDPVMRLWDKATAPGYDAFEGLTLADLVKDGGADRILKDAANDDDASSYAGNEQKY